MLLYSFWYKKLKVVEGALEATGNYNLVRNDDATILFQGET